MMLRRQAVVSIGAGMLGLLSGAVGCSGGGGAPKTANVNPADMPEGADWTGVYFDPLYGEFHLIQEGKSLNGKWERPKKDKWGEIHGEVTGNVFKFTWIEYTRGSVGMNAERNGKGYFVYARPEGANVDDTAQGEMGRGQDEVGVKISLVKQRNRTPDPGSIGGTGAADIGGGDWDTGNKEDGKPEPPAPP